MIRSWSKGRLSAPALSLLAAAILATPSEAAGRRGGPVRVAPEPELSGSAVLAVVSLARQRVTLYDAMGEAVRSPISSGQTGYETPVGVFSVLQKEAEHYSNLYDDAAMPHMQRITWSGVALHAGALPGYPASHGCIRLPHRFAERIFPMTRLGLRVVVSRDDVAPVPISHPMLFQPQPVGELVARAIRASYTTDESPLLPDVTNWPQRQALQQQIKAVADEREALAREAAVKVKPLKAAQKQRAAEHKKVAKAAQLAAAAKNKAQQSLERAERLVAAATRPSKIEAAQGHRNRAAAALAKAEAKLAAANAAEQKAAAALEGANNAAKAAEEAEAKAIAAADELKRRVLPVSVFISLKAQRLYIRQGREPVLDVPVTIRDPQQPIGTHVFTALDFTDGGNAVRWNVVSLAKRHGEDGGRSARRKAADELPPPTEVAAATSALDRITIPAEVAAKISESVWPTSSLIISDEELSKETGKATDFVVVVNSEPHGALKKRPRPPKRDYYLDDGYGYYGYQQQPLPPSRRYYNPPSKGLFGWW